MKIEKGSLKPCPEGSVLNFPININYISIETKIVAFQKNLTAIMLLSIRLINICYSTNQEHTYKTNTLSCDHVTRNCVALG